MTDVVVMSLEPWDGVWRRNQHLVAGLLRSMPGLRVLFVEPPADPAFQIARGRPPSLSRGVRQIRDVPGVAEGRLFGYQPTKLVPRRLDPRADGRIARAVVRVAERLEMSSPMLWVNDPAGAEVLALTGWPALYDITDDWLLADRAPAENARLRLWEGQLLRRCSEVVVCSPALAKSKGQDREVRLIPNAVDTAAYRAPAPRPADLPSGRTAVYVGTLHRDRLDVALCLRLADRLCGIGTIVMIGPILLPPKDLELMTKAGIRAMGPRPAREVPAYLQHADVLLVPHVVTPFTESLDPIKAYEYRAAGRPIIATPVAGFRGDRSGQVVAVDGRTFPELVAERLLEHVPTVRPEGVPDWADRVGSIREVLLAVKGAA